MLRRRTVSLTFRSTAASSYTSRFASSSSSSSRNSAEEQAELEREARLRQSFMRRQGGLLSSGNGFFQRMMTPPQGFAGQPGNPFAGQAPPSFGSMLYGFFLYSLAFYLLAITWEMRKPQSLAMAFQGAQQNVVPTEVLVCYIAIRTLLPQSKQREIQTDLEMYQKMNPTHNVYHYLMIQQPNLFSGHGTSQLEFIGALMAACNASVDTGRWTVSLRTRGSDVSLKVDAVMENLRREFPQAVMARRA